MKYTLHQLQVFLQVKETQSITKAAEELHLTQPAVSIQLKNLQDQFEVPLTELVGRKLIVTDFGKEIANAAKKILDEVQAINHKTMAYKGHLAGTLKISIVSTGKYVMPYFLSGFLHRYKAIDLVMDVTNKAMVIKSLEDHEVDFSLVSILPDHLALDKIDLMQNKLFLVSNSSMNSPRKALNKIEFEKLPLIYREAGSGTRQVMEKFLRKRNWKITKKMELTSNEAVKQAVLAGLGCSIMPLIGIRTELNAGKLKIIPVSGLPIESTWQLIWKKNKKFSPVAEAFLAYIRSEKNRIIEEEFQWSDNY